MSSLREYAENIQKNSAYLLEEIKKMMCEYCVEGKSEDDLAGSDGVILNKATGEHYLFIEYFRNERHRIRIDYCPQCGRKLKK